MTDPLVTRTPLPDPAEPDWPRRARVALSMDALAHLIGLPTGARMVMAETDHRRGAIGLFIEGPMFDPVPPYAEAPYVSGEWTGETLVVDDSRGTPTLYRRLTWQPS